MHYIWPHVLLRAQRRPSAVLTASAGAEITAAVADLAVKSLRCGDRNALEPAAVGRSTRTGNGWRARSHPAQRLRAALPELEMDDRPDDLFCVAG